MQSFLFSVARPVLHAMDAEFVHHLSIKSLKMLPKGKIEPDDPRLAVEAFGVRFPNPIGLAAGFDKQAEVIDQLFGWGFGFVEIGGVVPLAQSGNPKPRLFRLKLDEALINRMGFNSEGIEAMCARLRKRKGRPGVVAINIGANKESKDRLQDYVTCTEALTGMVEFLTVNVSSPNTSGLRDLQGEAFLDDLLARVLEARDKTWARNGSESAAKTAILLKISPDISLSDLDAIVATAMRRRVEGLVVTNSTVSRPAMLRCGETLKAETGGLSGPPIFEMSTRVLAETYLRIGKSMPLIGVGGVDDVETAWAKIRAGATLVEFYTALVYKGPALVNELKQGFLQKIGDGNLMDAIGKDATQIAAGEFGFPA